MLSSQKWLMISGVAIMITSVSNVNLLPETQDKNPVSKAASPAVTSESKIIPTFTFEDLKKQHNSFRGPFGQGISYMKNIPVDWDGASGKNVLWKVPVTKPGGNSPVIWDDKLFIAGVEGITGYVMCFDKNTGILIWEKDASGVAGSPTTDPKVGEETGLSASTMAVDGSGVYAIFGTGVLIAFDLNGNRLWARALGVPDNHYGHSSSLLVWDSKVIVQYDANRGGRLIAVNNSNGEFVWDVRRTSKISWASPILIRIDGNYQIVTSSVPLVAAYDPVTGSQLWAVNCMSGEVAPSPAFSDGLVFAGNEYAKLVAIKPGAEPEVIWDSNEYLPEVSSPVAKDGLVYIATVYGIFVCYDAKNGEKYWEHEFENGFYSSPIIADGKIYIIDLSGVTHIFKEGKEKVIIAEPALGERVFASPVFSDGKIYIKGKKNLYCFGNK